jgi:HlyD family secretion protein
MRRSILLLSCALGAAACDKDVPDAYGTFEATEVTVSAEASGRLLAVPIAEGVTVRSGALLAVVDTTALALQRDELRARRASVQSKRAEIAAQQRVIEAQRTVSQRTFDRTARLVAASAATAQQSDAATRDLRTLEAQLEATTATQATIARDLYGVDAQIATLDDRIRRARVVAPVAGTILARFVEAGEVVQPGSPIVKVASLDTLVLRAYVSGAQLAQVKLGSTVQVRVDAGAGTLRTLSGQVTWIAANAEFTPTPIQTREERVTQVYAVKIQVANPDGVLKIGTPGELVLGTAAK